MRLSGSDLITALSEECGLSSKVAAEVLAAFLGGIQTGLLSGSEVRIHDFGNFKVVAGARGRRVRFRPSGRLRAQAEGDAPETRPGEVPARPVEIADTGPVGGGPAQFDIPRTPGSGDAAGQPLRAEDPTAGPTRTVSRPEQHKAGVTTDSNAKSIEHPPRKPNGGGQNTRADWASAGGRGLFYAAEMVLVLLIAYLCWTTGSRLLELQEPAADTSLPEAFSVPGQVPALVSQSPLRAYRVVWDRNLFGEAAAARREKLDLDKIALAGKDIGLKLIGTAVGKDPERNFAIIEVLSSRDQGLYREREHVGKTVIRAILRNNVVVENEDGSRRRLSVDEQPGAGRNTVALEAAAEPPEVVEFPNVFQVRRDQVPSSPEAIRNTIEESNLRPQEQEGGLEGFAVGRLIARDALFQAGLRTGDILKGVDGEEFRSEQDLEYFFHRLARGGEISIMAERRGMPVQLNAVVE